MEFRALKGPIVIEGIDGSGKGEQFKLLVDRLKGLGLPVETMDFPQYDSPSSYFIKKYLNGDYGKAEEVSPEAASLFYAMDRFDAVSKINEFLKQGKILVFNRYTFSNLAHQGGKIEKKNDRYNFFIQISIFEHSLLNIPLAHLNIICDMPEKIAMRLIESKNKDTRRYLKCGNGKDIHEASLEHLRNARQTYLELANYFGKEAVVVKCAPRNRLLPINEIHKMIWKIVKKELGI